MIMQRKGPGMRCSVAQGAVIVAVASAGSPSVAAAILSVASWRWLFLVNVPIGALALMMAARTLPATPRTPSASCTATSSPPTCWWTLGPAGLSTPT